MIHKKKNFVMLCFALFFSTIFCGKKFQSYCQNYAHKRDLKTRTIIKPLLTGINSMYKKVLFLYAVENDNALFKKVLKDGIDVDTKSIFTGATPLHTFCENNEFDMVELCLQNKANVNAQKRNGETPLTIACKEKRFEIFQKLWLKKGAKKSKKGIALTKACKKKCFDIVQKLIEKGANVNYRLKRYEEREIVGQRDCGKYGKHLEEKSKWIYGYRPLILACKKNDSNIAMFLIESGADVNVCTESTNDDLDYKATPLVWASYHNNRELIDFLLKNDAIPTKRVLECACHHDNRELIEFSLETDVKITEKALESASEPMKKCLKEIRKSRKSQLVSLFEVNKVEEKSRSKILKKE